MWSGGHGFKYVFLLHPRSTAPLSSVSYCQFSHEYTGGTPTCISFTEGQLLGGLDLAINGKPHTPSLTFDGFSLGQTRRLVCDKQGCIGQLELSQIVAGV